MSEEFTEQGSNMPKTIFHEFTGILVVVCSGDVWGRRDLTMYRGVKDSLIRNSVLIPECGI